jgi:hypothetical protein
VTNLIISLLKPVLYYLAMWLARRSAGRQAAKIEEHGRYVETSKRIDAVESMPNPDAAAEWLRRRAQRKRDL